MSVLDERVFTRLKVLPLTLLRCYPSPAPQGVTVPYITHTDIFDSPEVDMDGGGSDCGKRARKQFDCWANTKDQAVTIANQVRNALDAADVDLEFSAAEQSYSGVHFYEQDTKLHRVMLDFSMRYE